MQRRDFVRLGLAAGTLGAGAAAAARPGSGGIDPATAGVAELSAGMAAGTLSATALVDACRARIGAIDRAGPRLNAVIELNPDATRIAAALDRERRAQGPRGPLHGIPVLLKDNIATADRMQTTAGSLALVGSRPPEDAFLVTRLRAAGVVILGKTNLSEWANFRSTRSTSGWSARGGLTRNPYALDRNTSGSSSGAGAAIAAGLAPLAVGTETDGSIVSPSSINGLVGVKPTVGLVSRSGIVPIAASMDTAGPMTRTVRDAALLLTALAGGDDRDPATTEASRHAVDYTRHLDARGLAGKRLGVVRSQFGGDNDLVSAVVEAELDVLRAAGATLIDLPELPGAGRYDAAEYEVLLHEFKAGIADYLAQYASEGPHRNLADLIAFNEANRAREMRYFGQEHFLLAQAKGGLDSPAYRDAVATCRRYARAEGIDQALAEHRLDALVAPTGAPAWLSDLIRGDHSGGGFSSPAAVAGYPHITVPAGAVHGLPCGISFVGTAWSEPVLFAIAYAYEQATHRRRAPTFARTVNPA